MLQLLAGEKETLFINARARICLQLPWVRIASSVLMFGQKTSSRLFAVDVEHLHTHHSRG
jgi:hypothetical protein